MVRFGRPGAVTGGSRHAMCSVSSTALRCVQRASQTRRSRDDRSSGSATPGQSWSTATSTCGALPQRLSAAFGEAGGLPLEFPTISLGENLMKPTTMLYRNLMSMDVEETIRSSPLDSVVLVGGCDKTIPAQLMGAASVDVPAIVFTGGPHAARALPRQAARLRHRPVALHGTICGRVGCRPRSTPSSRPQRRPLSATAARWVRRRRSRPSSRASGCPCPGRRRFRQRTPDGQLLGSRPAAGPSR